MYNNLKMYGGGPLYTANSAKVIRYAGILVPIVLVVYGVLVQFEIAPSFRIIDPFSFVALSFWALYIGILQLFSSSRNARESALRLIAYHLLLGGYLVFVAGVSTPFSICWVLLLMASNTYFGKRGVSFSALAFTLVVVGDSALWYSIDADIASYNFVTLAIILIAGFIILSISAAQSATRKELNTSKAKEALQRDRTLAIVNNLTDGVLSVDQEGLIKVYNAASLNLLDTNDKLDERHVDDILPLVDQDGKHISLFAEMQKAKGVVRREDLSYRFDEDETMRLEVAYSPIRSGFSRTKKAETHEGYVVILRDITKVKSLEEERDEFISVVSHELRTPITITEGTISNVQVMMEHGDTTKDMLKDAVTTAHDQIIFLAQIVNDLSTLSRAERGVSDAPEIIDVKELIKQMFEKYQEEAKDKKLHLNIDIPPKLDKVNTSRLYLEEMMQNFITNAIKYTVKGSVTLAAKQEDGKITIEVIDTGIGISKSDQSKVFEKFYRSEDYRTRETGGTGLGLYIASKLSRRIGAKIQLKSRLNHGSTFSITLPIAKESN